jgi:DNA-binding GntR family transcriptional regulator
LFVRLLVASPGRSKRAEDDHRRICSALSAGDADAVQAEIRSHLSVTVASVTAVLEDLKGT